MIISTLIIDMLKPTASAIAIEMILIMFIYFCVLKFKMAY